MCKKVYSTIGEEDVEQVYTRSFRVNGYAKMSSEYFIVIINLESDQKKTRIEFSNHLFYIYLCLFYQFFQVSQEEKHKLVNIV